MDDNVKKIGAGILALIALVLIVKSLFFSGGTDYDINSGDPVERLAAVEDYRMDKSNASREVLIRVAESDDDIRVKLSTIRAMSFNRSEQTEATLRKMSQNAPAPRVRGEALAALGNYETVSTQELTSSLKASSTPEERAGAAKGLMRRADRRSIPALYEALFDPDVQVRAWSISAIRQIVKAGFAYDPKKEPREQMDVLRHINSYLRSKGFY